MNDYSKYNDTQLADLILSDSKKIKEEVFLEIYNRYNRAIYSYIAKLLGNQNDTYDIFQDVFCKFIETTNKKIKIDNIRSFLLTIARNSCFNFLKKHREIYIEDLAEIIYEDKKYENNELLQILRKAIDTLDAPSRDICILRYYEDLSYQEISEITGESINNIKNKIWRSKENLKNILKPYLKELNVEIKNKI